MNKQSFFSFLFFLIQTHFSIGQTPLGDLQFQTLSTKNGLSQSINPFVFQDSQGFVWLSSLDGLNKFDGQEIQVFKENKDKNGLKGAYSAGFFCEDSRGNLWFGTEKAINCYRRKEADFLHFFISDEQGKIIENEDLHAIFMDDQNRLWLMVNNRLMIFDFAKIPGKSGQIQAKHTFPLKNATLGKVVKTGENRYSLFAYEYYRGAGLCEYEFDSDLVRLKNEYFGEAKSGETIQGFWQKNADTIYCAAKTGLLILNTKSGKHTKIDNFNGQKTGICGGIQALDERFAYVSTDNCGLLLFDADENIFVKQWIPAQGENKKPQPLNEIYLDPNGNLWLTAWMQGVYFTNVFKNKFGHFAQGSDAGKMSADAAGNIWLTSNHFEKASFFDAHFKEKKTPPNLPQKDIKNVLTDKNGSTWFLTNKAIFYQNLPNSALIKVANSANSADFDFLEMVELSGNEDLFVSISDGPYFLKISKNKGKPKLSDAPEFSAIGFSPNKIFQQKNGDLLLLNEQNLTFWTLKTAKWQLKKSVPTNGSFENIFETEAQTWLIGQAGLAYLSGQDSVLQTPKNFPSQIVYSCLSDQNGNFWLGLGAGLAFFDPKRDSFHLFSVADGIQNIEFNGGSSMQLKTGEMLFGGINGVNVFSPENFRVRKNPAPIQITQFYINEQAATGFGNPEMLDYFSLPHDSATIAFSFVVLDFADPQNNRLQYRLEFKNGKPYDEKWLDCRDARGFARYARLPEGDYVFRIRGANSDGVWNPAERLVKFEIRPPFYRTWWFYAICALTFSGFLYAIYRVRLEQERLKTRIGLSQFDALRAQLNAHFISNSMSAISGFIQKRDFETAEDYLRNFAKLLRTTLDNARKPMVLLEKELELTEKYIQVERHRFPAGNLKYEILVAPELVEEEIYVPGMILQPFVENAIKHGLAPKNGEGKITLTVSKKEKHLVFLISDNGVGKNAGFQANDREHISHSTTIMQERLVLYDKQKGGKSYLKTEISERGTCVELGLGL